jgi:hypothetical protein
MNNVQRLTWSARMHTTRLIVSLIMLLGVGPVAAQSASAMLAERDRDLSQGPGPSFLNSIPERGSPAGAPRAHAHASDPNADSLTGVFTSGAYEIRTYQKGNTIRSIMTEHGRTIGTSTLNYSYHSSFGR